MQKLALSIIFFLLSNYLLSQSSNFLWAKQIGGTNTDIGYSIAVDANGNIYTTGYFIGTVDFDPSPGIYNLTSVGGSDIFISKLPICSIHNQTIRRFVG